MLRRAGAPPTALLRLIRVQRQGGRGEREGSVACPRRRIRRDGACRSQLEQAAAAALLLKLLCGIRDGATRAGGPAAGASSRANYIHSNTCNPRAGRRGATHVL